MFPVALACGNCFIRKPSERDPSPSLLFADLLTRARLPDGVFNVIEGDKVLQARLHAHSLIAKIPRTRRWRVANYGSNVMGTSLYLREHHFPNVYSGVVHCSSLIMGALMALALVFGVVGWVLQFIGHLHEGREPAFVDVVVGLLIGPLFVLAEALFAFGIKCELQERIEAVVGATRAGRPTTPA